MTPREAVNALHKHVQGACELEHAALGEGSDETADLVEAIDVLDKHVSFAPDMTIMLLHSEDGQEYAHAVLYPSAWGSDKADDLAKEAFTEAQRENPEEWSWEDFEPKLLARGFVIPCWHHGLTWDRQRV